MYHLLFQVESFSFLVAEMSRFCSHIKLFEIFYLLLPLFAQNYGRIEEPYKSSNPRTSEENIWYRDFSTYFYVNSEYFNLNPVP